MFPFGEKISVKEKEGDREASAWLRIVGAATAVAGSEGETWWCATPVVIVFRRYSSEKTKKKQVDGWSRSWVMGRKRREASGGRTGVDIGEAIIGEGIGEVIDTLNGLETP
ncbi:hypothetical protein HAX54_040750 [Datura stramonium]|uniref:Uncharacterized protein n=1 Tax=Datura stramonium TaxID=4076 RepID=A0ABS8RNC8_DATST|nr:hypothetical protein [Datura stramonium]